MVHRVVCDNGASAISLTDSNLEDQDGDCDQAHCHKVGHEPLQPYDRSASVQDMKTIALTIVVVYLDAMSVIVATASNSNGAYLARVSDQVTHSCAREEVSLVARKATLIA
jgi:hypothetical protein